MRSFTRHDLAFSPPYPIWKYASSAVVTSEAMIKVFRDFILCDQENAHVLLTIGSSGVFLAGLIAAKEPYFQEDFRILHLRKSNESHHGCTNSFQFPSFLRHHDLPLKFWFVDDFVESGSTLRNVIRIFKAMSLDACPVYNPLSLGFSFAGAVVGSGFSEDCKYSALLDEEKVSDFILHSIQ